MVNINKKKLGNMIGENVVGEAGRLAIKKGVQKALIKSGSSLAAKAAAGPVGWAAAGFEVATLGLDIWDPAGWAETLDNEEIEKIRNNYLTLNRELYDENEFDILGEKIKGKDIPEELGGPITFPLELYPDYPQTDDNGQFINTDDRDIYVDKYNEFMRENNGEEIILEEDGTISQIENNNEDNDDNNEEDNDTILNKIEDIIIIDDAPFFMQPLFWFAVVIIIGILIAIFV